MAICGHYSPPMSHSNAPECSFFSFRAAAVGFSTTLLLLPLLLLLLPTVAVIIDVYSLILPPQTDPTDPPACLQPCKVLFIWQHDQYTHAHTHTNYGLSNGGSSHAVSPCRVYPFHSGSIPCSYSTFPLFSSFNLSLSLCTSTVSGSSCGFDPFGYTDVVVFHQAWEWRAISSKNSFLMWKLMHCRRSPGCARARMCEFSHCSPQIKPQQQNKKHNP